MESSRDQNAPALLDDFLERFSRAGPDARLVVLTGAGISEESGIPTFRGADGFWTIGSQNYAPQEIATWSMFQRAPEAVWAWYLERIVSCWGAKPNPAHHALVDIERSMGPRFALITQNVDGLHGRAGSSRERMFTVHGDFQFVRLAGDDHAELKPIDRRLFDEDSAALGAHRDGVKRTELSEAERAILRREDGRWYRPHVLWFDECYDERWFSFETSMRLASESDGLIVVGTSGATTLPSNIVSVAVNREVPIVVIGPEETVFSEAAERAGVGGLWRSSAVAAVPELARHFVEDTESPS
ncbi:MAG: Sir2 family NAD-dependent protein deacetylase [Planctomycetota bacterium]